MVLDFILHQACSGFGKPYLRNLCFPSYCCCCCIRAMVVVLVSSTFKWPSRLPPFRMQFSALFASLSERGYLAISTACAFTLTGSQAHICVLFWRVCTCTYFHR